MLMLFFPEAHSGSRHGCTELDRKALRPRAALLTGRKVLQDDKTFDVRRRMRSMKDVEKARAFRFFCLGKLWYT